MTTIPVMLIVAALAADNAEPAFTIHLPSAKIGYPGAEYWAAIEGPDGKQSWAFAIYTGEDAWTVPLRAETSGTYRLARIEKRQGDKREDIACAETPPPQVDVRRASDSTATTTPDGGNHTVSCVTNEDLVRWGDRKVVFG